MTMSYTVAACCHPGAAGGGLGQAALVPRELEAQLQILNDMVRSLHPKAVAVGDPNLIAWVEDAARLWARANELLYFDGRLEEASRAIVEGISRLHKVAAQIEQRFRGLPTGVKAEAEARAGASVVTQIQRTASNFVSEPVARALETVSPAAAQAVRSTGWLGPLVAGGALLFLLRR